MVTLSVNVSLIPFTDGLYFHIFSNSHKKRVKNNPLPGNNPENDYLSRLNPGEKIRIKQILFSPLATRIFKLVNWLNRIKV